MSRILVTIMIMMITSAPALALEPTVSAADRAYIEQLRAEQCRTQANRQKRNMILGALIGGTAGALLGGDKHTNQIVSSATAGVAGSAIGKRLGGDLDCSNQR